MTKLKVVIVDPQLMFVQSLTSKLESQNEVPLEVISHFKSGENIRQNLSRNLDIDLLLIELNLTGEDGLELIPTIRKYFRELKIMVLTNYDDYKYVKEALINGADGYILKSNDFDELIEGIQELQKNNTYIAKGLHITPPSSSKRMLQNGKNSRYEDRFIIKRKLTKREHEVLALIAQAKNNKEIAEQLFISDQTVCVHRKNIMRKLGVRNTVNLIKLALEHQLVQ